MKKLHISFGIIAAIMTFVAIVVGVVLFFNNIGDTYTSFPAWAVFILVGIYYVIGLAVLGVIWLIAWLILRSKTCRNR